MTTGSVADGIDMLATGLRAGRLTSVGLVEECLRRIERGASVNAVVEYFPDEALRSARVADDRLRRDPTDVGPLCGIPVTVKRTFAVRGFTHGEKDVDPGSPYGVAARRDAAVVASLRTAGAVVLGRSNAPVRAADIDTWHPDHGRTAHPIDTRLSPGGSSGGSAAAVRAGHSTFDIGSDVAGSARIPAHACGVFALRPTMGTTSALGHVPGPATQDDMAEMLTVCPVTRSAEDLEIVWNVLWGRHRPEHAAGRSPAGTARPPLAVVSADASAPLSGEVAESLEIALDRLRAHGHRVEEVRLPVDLAENWLLCQQLLYAEDEADSPAHALPRPLAGADPVEVAWWSAGMSHRDWRRLHRQRIDFQLKWARFFSAYSALLLPVLGRTALPPRDPRIPLLADRTSVGGTDLPVFSLSAWCAVPSVAGLPAVSMPVVPGGSGLPVGLQVIAGHGQESELLALVRRFARLISPNPALEVRT
ncbi:amidase family protein [Streptomyces sp. WI04-05B]|uniref:amidase family protein n=1 Tax=Streptomyces TaxID=1883 RepID=UPI0029A4391A|nr:MULTISPECIES: amidase family protein [unclassified Streptomyces]MDX2547632.1 amidase family protein [Streptomyces sp. WI04-05B]MDX2590112.1 amidase family protein [Streptomyces sp. WI04-05A]MDX3752848.1 amidase family protein [Streptomyces sp. AK08-02]